MSVKVDYNFIITNIQFPGIVDSKFRVISVANTDQTVVTVKIEKLNSAQLWQFEITNLNKHEPPGIPKSVIIKTFKQAIERLVKVDNTPSDTVKVESGDAASIDLIMDEDGGLSTILHVPVMGIHIDFPFKFLPVSRDTTEVLQNQLYDALEEIDSLKRRVQYLENKPVQSAFISLKCSGKIIVPPDFAQHHRREPQFTKLIPDYSSIVIWDIIDDNSSPTTFQRSDNHQEITILSSGWYIVNCRMTRFDSVNIVVTVRKNGKIVGGGRNGHNTGIDDSAGCCCTIQFNANDKLSVFYFANSSDVFDKAASEGNDLSIVKLSDL